MFYLHLQIIVCILINLYVYVTALAIKERGGKKERGKEEEKDSVEFVTEIP